MIQKYKLEAQLNRLRNVLADIVRLSATKKITGMLPRQRLAEINFIAEYERKNIQTNRPQKAEGGE